MCLHMFMQPIPTETHTCNILSQAGPNDDNSWLIEFYIRLLTSGWHPFHLTGKKNGVSCVCVCVCGRACPPLHTAGDICQFNSTRNGGDSCTWVSSVYLKKIMCEQGLLHFNESTLLFLPRQISFHLSYVRVVKSQIPELGQHSVFMWKRSLTKLFHSIFL